MRMHLIILMVGAGMLGCATHKDRSDDTLPSPSRRSKKASEGSRASLPASSLSITNQDKIITLTESFMGKVVAVNASLRFVVVDFSLNTMPVKNQRLGVFREGRKVGELRVTGPERDGNTVADVTRGEAQIGDEARREQEPISLPGRDLER